MYYVDEHIKNTNRVFPQQGRYDYEDLAVGGDIVEYGGYQVEHRIGDILYKIKQTEFGHGKDGHLAPPFDGARRPVRRRAWVWFLIYGL